MAAVLFTTDIINTPEDLPLYWHLARLL